MNRASVSFLVVMIGGSFETPMETFDQRSTKEVETGPTFSEEYLDSTHFT